MTNNDIFKKLRVALQLRDDQIVEILELVDFRISKGEIGNFFRTEDHPKFVECQDQVLRNFLNGLVIHLRGTKENPKNPKDVLDHIKATKQPLMREDGTESRKTEKTTSYKGDKPNSFKSDKKGPVKSFGKSTQKSTTKSNDKSAAPTKKDILGNFKYNVGKPKRKDGQ